MAVREDQVLGSTQAVQLNGVHLLFVKDLLPECVVELATNIALNREVLDGTSVTTNQIREHELENWPHLVSVITFREVETHAFNVWQCAVAVQELAGYDLGTVSRIHFEIGHADQLLEKVGLGGKGDMALGQLTYIDTKRVELARTLASDPKVLLLDEWLAGMNPTELQIGITLIKSLRDEGRTIILVEHVMDAIRSLCDRCVVMAAGTKIAEGTPSQVLSDKEVIRAYLGDDDA